MTRARRGTVYQLTTGPFEEGVAITDDPWNDVMHEVGFIPIVASTEQEALPPPWTVRLSDARKAVTGRPLSLPLDRIGTERRTLGASDMTIIGEGLVDVLGLASLLGAPFQSPPAAAGGTYPRWGRSYWVHQRIANEEKFHLVVSADDLNARAPAVSVVRCTSTPRGLEFPELVRGTHACCGNLTSFPVHAIDLNQLTPVPTIALPRMRRVAAAIATTHGLGPAVALTDAELEEILR